MEKNPQQHTSNNPHKKYDVALRYIMQCVRSGSVTLSFAKKKSSLFNQPAELDDALQSFGRLLRFKVWFPRQHVRWLKFLRS